MSSFTTSNTQIRSYFDVPRTEIYWSDPTDQANTVNFMKSSGIYVSSLVVSTLRDIYGKRVDLARFPNGLGGRYYNYYYIEANNHTKSWKLIITGIEAQILLSYLEQFAATNTAPDPYTHFGLNFIKIRNKRGLIVYQYPNAKDTPSEESLFIRYVMGDPFHIGERFVIANYIKNNPDIDLITNFFMGFLITISSQDNIRNISKYILKKGTMSIWTIMKEARDALRRKEELDIGVSVIDLLPCIAAAKNYLGDGHDKGIRESIVDEEIRERNSKKLNFSFRRMKTKATRSKSRKAKGNKKPVKRRAHQAESSRSSSKGSKTTSKKKGSAKKSRILERASSARKTRSGTGSSAKRRSSGKGSKKRLRKKRRLRKKKRPRKKKRTRSKRSKKNRRKRKRRQKGGILYSPRVTII